MILKFLTILLISSAQSKITLENGLLSTQITLNDIHSFSEVLVEAKFNYIDNDKYEKVHLAIRSINKHKKQAYVDLMKKFHGVIKTLVKMKAIPNKESMINSVVHKNYLKKMRKWQFSRYFVVYALKEQISQILQKLQIYRTQIIKNAPITNYLDEKFMSIAAFLESKLELEKFIKQRLNGEYKILLTKDIEIMGQKLANEQIIQDHIQQEFNEMKDQRSQQITNEIRETQQVEGYYARGQKQNKKQPKTISMKVLFQLVEKSADVQDIFEKLQSEIDEDSISDFEAEINTEGDNQDERQLAPEQTKDDQL